ncbi:hypothetical protein DSM104299_02810 [Baekduia alba]|uniref:hypothetical protein n=1 Tax=Baekduia alba TaxID=2997333 RepID=UPI0023414F03|nr:hypothetical protein [Baekduia alba]WCB94082.1 hypothetical protein DSM104299_02810 [Baekduia alba]
MTARTPEPPDRDPLLSAADSEVVGRHIHELALTVEAPPALRARIAEAERTRPKRARAWLRRPRIVLPALAGTALAAVLVGVLAFAGGAAGPSVDEAAALALARPTAAAPAATGSVALDERVGGITFPNYAYQWPAWKAAGMRHDRLGGRDATTITYRGPKGDVGYTIVDGRPLPEPDGARTVNRAGLKLSIYRKDGATVVTWRRDGHTCVLAGKGKGVEPQLVKFATWA